MSYLIYKLNKAKIPTIYNIDATLKVWKPSILNMHHSRLPFKYIIWWFYNFFKIFKNKKIQIWLYYINNELAHFFCIVPKYYRWPFMKKNDVQVTYVITEKEYRGKKLAFNGIAKALNELQIDGDIWYVTDSSNIASQKLAKKLGFELFSEGARKVSFGGFIKILKLK